MVVSAIVLCFILQKKVNHSYIKTYRWLRKRNATEMKRQFKVNSHSKGRYKTIIEVQAPSKRVLRTSLVFLDLAYIAMCAYGISIYVEQREKLREWAGEPPTLITVILPMLSSLGVLMVFRMIISIFFFLVIPFWSVRD